jgi:uncharacterized protein YqeY
MLLDQLASEIKDAMRAKDQVKLRSLRLIKSALMLLHSEGGAAPTEESEMAVLVKMAKQRKDSIAIFEKEGRDDLAQKEKEELDIISTYLPKQLSEDEVKSEVAAIIAQTGASSMKDMGKIMGIASQKMKGKADGKLISQLVKELLG